MQRPVCAAVVDGVEKERLKSRIMVSQVVTPPVDSFAPVCANAHHSPVSTHDPPMIPTVEDDQKETDANGDHSRLRRAK